MIPLESAFQIIHAGGVLKDFVVRWPRTPFFVRRMICEAGGCPRKISLFLFVLTLLCVSMSAMSQDFRLIREKAERAVRTKWPDWKLLHRSEYEKQVFYSWSGKKKGITILIFYGDSSDDAAQRMESKNNMISVGPGKKRQNFGDEAYYSTNNKDTWAQIRFRKAKLYVEVTAPSLTVAEELARELLKPVKKK